MGKTKVKAVDDSAPEKKEAKSKGPRKDELVEKLKAELGIQEKPSPVAVETPEQKEEVKETESQPKRETKQPKLGKQKPRGKKYEQALQLIDPNVKYPLNEAVELVKKISYSKFDGTLEAHLNTNVKSLKGSVALPFVSGKKVKVLAFGKGAEESGADMIGDDTKLDQIKQGKIDFDILITTPEWMSKFAPLAKILGPKGLMPNPKNGTITEDLRKAVNEIQTGKTEYKNEPTGRVVHLTLGKISQPSSELSQNIKVLIQSIGKTKLTKVVLSPTMGPGIKLDLASI